jgi:hypothetical protein
MKLYWQMIRAGGNEKPADPLEAVDELAERRGTLPTNGSGPPPDE